MSEQDVIGNQQSILANQARIATSDFQVIGLLIQYGLLIGAGLAFYGGCLAIVRRRLLVDGLARWRWPAEIGLHAVCWSPFPTASRAARWSNRRT